MNMNELSNTVEFQLLFSYPVHVKRGLPRQLVLKFCKKLVIMYNECPGKMYKAKLQKKLKTQNKVCLEKVCGSRKSKE